MSVYLKCKAGGSTFKVEGKTTAEKPYLAMNYTTQTGSNSSQTTMSKAYFPVSTDTEFVIPGKSIAINADSSKYYVINNTNTTTTTIESTETKYTGIAYIPVGDPLLTISKIPYMVGTSTDCGGVSAGWVTTGYTYAAFIGISYYSRSLITSSLSDYYSNTNNSITLFNNSSNITTSNETSYYGMQLRTSTDKNIAMTDTRIPIITNRGNVYFAEIVNNNKYLGLFAQTRYSSSESHAGYNNTSYRRFPYRMTYSYYEYSGAIYSSYETQTSSGTSFNYSCSEYVEEVLTKTIITSITD